MRILVITAIAVGIIWRVVTWSPVFGFALVTAALTFLIHFQFGLERFRFERPFFFGKVGTQLGNLAAVPVALFTSIVMAFVTGVAALFTFPARVAESLGAGLSGDSDLDALIEFLEILETHTDTAILLFSSLVVLGVVAGLLLDRGTNGRGHRWAIFKFAAVLGLVFSVSTVAVDNLSNQNSAYSSPPPGAVVGGIKVVNYVIEAPGCDAAPDTTARVACRGGEAISNAASAAGRWIGNQLNKARGKKTPSISSEESESNNTVVSVQETFAAVTILDAFLDELVVKTVSETLDLYRDVDAGEDDLSDFALRSIFSSKIAQGFVLSTWISLILVVRLWFRKR